MPPSRMYYYLSNLSSMLFREDLLNLFAGDFMYIVDGSRAVNLNIDEHNKTTIRTNPLPTSATLLSDA